MHVIGSYFEIRGHDSHPYKTKSNISNFTAYMLLCVCVCVSWCLVFRKVGWMIAGLVLNDDDDDDEDDSNNKDKGKVVPVHN